MEIDLKRGIPMIATLAGIAVLGAALYDCGKKTADSKVADLTTKLAESEKTIEVKDGLYSTTIVEMTNVKNLLDSSIAAVAGLKKQLDETQAQLLTTQQVSVKWKNAYEAELKAHQKDPCAPTATDPAPCPTSPPEGRTEVDFTGDLGPIHASGHTLTNPAEAFLKLDQIRPLVLTVAVAKNKDGKWQSYVTSSEPNMQVDVNLAGVDPGVTSPSWKQRIWGDVGVDFLMGRRASLGASYHLDRYSIGVSCSVWEGGNGCGLTAGFRLFQ